MNGAAVREFSPEDLAGLLGIQRASPETAQWSARDYEWLAQQPGGLVLVAGDSSAVLGFVAARAIGPEAELQNLAVWPERRRSGVASALIEELHRRLLAAGAQRVYLELRESNLAALNLYRRFGYVERGRRRSYYSSNGEDALVLEVRLAS